MATTHNPSNFRIEHCPSCGEERPHDVTIQLRTESRKETNRAFSREPYRIAECDQCGEKTHTRMNNA